MTTRIIYLPPCAPVAIAYPLHVLLASFLTPLIPYLYFASSLFAVVISLGCSALTCDWSFLRDSCLTLQTGVPEPVPFFGFCFLSPHVETTCPWSVSPSLHCLCCCGHLLLRSPDVAAPGAAALRSSSLSPTCTFLFPLQPVTCTDVDQGTRVTAMSFCVSPRPIAGVIATPGMRIYKRCYTMNSFFGRRSDFTDHRGEQHA